MHERQGCERRRRDSRSVLLHSWCIVWGVRASSQWLGLVDRLCDCGFPSCRATRSGATARRNNVHSVQRFSGFRCASIGGSDAFVCFARLSVQMSVCDVRADGWTASFRLVPFRFVSEMLVPVVVREKTCEQCRRGIQA